MANFEEIFIDQGSTFTAEVTVKKDGLPFDLTDYSYEGQIRKTTDTNIVETFTIAQSEDSDETNVLVISLTPAQTSNLILKKYLFDIEVTSLASDSTDVFRVIQGYVHVSPEVTRDSD